MYDPEEDAQLLIDLKKVINEKWNTFSELDANDLESNNEPKTSFHTFNSTSGLPIAIDHLNRTEKRKIANKQKNISKVGPGKKKIKIDGKNSQNKRAERKIAKNQITDYEEDDDGKISKILKIFKVNN